MEGERGDGREEEKKRNNDFESSFHSNILCSNVHCSCKMNGKKYRFQTFYAYCMVIFVWGPTMVGGCWYISLFLLNHKQSTVKGYDRLLNASNDENTNNNNKKKNWNKETKEKKCRKPTATQTNANDMYMCRIVNNY